MILLLAGYGLSLIHILTATEIISIFLTNKRIEQEKEKYTDALSSILNHMQSSVYVINPQTFKIIFMNQKTIEL